MLSPSFSSSATPNRIAYTFFRITDQLLPCMSDACWHTSVLPPDKAGHPPQTPPPAGLPPLLPPPGPAPGAGPRPPPNPPPRDPPPGVWGVGPALFPRQYA